LFIDTDIARLLTGRLLPDAPPLAPAAELVPDWDPLTPFRGRPFLPRC
jgi:hypothetical protein